MGSGKSAVGRSLARILGLAFVDTDTEIEDRTGVDIPYIFEKEGESGFRLRESAVLAECVEQDNTVLATGGGVIEIEANRELLARNGTVVYLYTSVPEQIRRTANSRGRPLLANRDRAEVLEELMHKRDPHYRAVADLVIETDGKVSQPRCEGAGRYAGWFGRRQLPTLLNSGANSSRDD